MSYSNGCNFVCVCVFGQKAVRDNTVKSISLALCSYPFASRLGSLAHWELNFAHLHQISAKVLITGEPVTTHPRERKKKEHWLNFNTTTCNNTENSCKGKCQNETKAIVNNSFYMPCLNEIVSGYRFVRGIFWHKSVPHTEKRCACLSPCRNIRWPGEQAVGDFFKSGL